MRRLIQGGVLPIRGGRKAGCEDVKVLARNGKEMRPGGGLTGWKGTVHGLGGLCVVKEQV